MPLQLTSITTIIIRLITRAALVLLLVAVSGTAQADLEGKLNEYYGSLGGGASLTPSAMHQGQ